MDGISPNSPRSYPITWSTLKSSKLLDKDTKLSIQIFQASCLKISKRMWKTQLRFLWELKSLRLIRNISSACVIRFFSSLIIEPAFRSIWKTECKLLPLILPLLLEKLLVLDSSAMLEVLSTLLNALPLLFRFWEPKRRSSRPSKLDTTHQNTV